MLQTNALDCFETIWPIKYFKSNCEVGIDTGVPCAPLALHYETCYISTTSNEQQHTCKRQYKLEREPLKKTFVP